MRNRQGQRAGSGAQVEDDRVAAAVAFEEGQRPPEQQFRLGPRDEHPRPHCQVDLPHRRGTGDVLQRNPLRALFDHRAVGVDGRRIDERDQSESPALDAEQVRCEKFGVDRGLGTPASSRTDAASMMARRRG